MLERSGARVRGHYGFGLGLGTLEGWVEGERLYFDWDWAGDVGRGLLEREGADGLSGTWGSQRAREGAGTWRLRHVGAGE